ncbi:Na+/H+ antiporter NhaC family protein [Glaciibacter psychrotolerans]|uniref:Na+/H+ antiporter NhaC n=1 Tax=Glaciibacter psychrotolerans TaxID=670054 RepID=A0A7Z0EHA8_9MICO|nr:Na+/H+ antiporter NhaC family protein [Leifsonia psychrotolerans]NYJ20897.1 Na+/H+ antiporter NhaC [Leifsonia psychrotolerans]
MNDFGALSLLPVICVLVVAVFTRRTLLALVCGTVVGSVLLGGFGFFDSWVHFVGASMSDETLQWLVTVVVLFGILITLFERSGAVNDFAVWAERFVNSRRKSLVLTYILGVVMFVDDYLNALAVGTSMKNLTDRYGVPRTLLGMLVKSTAAPICVIVPFSTWAIFFSGLLEAEGVTVNGSGFGAYLQAIPYIFFGWIMLVIGLLVAIGVFPMLGSVRTDSERAQRTGDVFPASMTAEERAEELGQDAAAEAGGLPIGGRLGPDADGVLRPAAASGSVAVLEATGVARVRRALPYNFVIPLVTMVAVTILTEVDVLKGTTAALLVAIVLYVIQRKMSIKQVMDAAFAGVSSMLFVILLSVLAFMVQKINIDLGLADFVISSTEPFMSGAWLPAIVFLVCGVYAYATGSFWDLAAIITPIVIPLALAMNVDPILAASAIFSGAALGSTTCLYGDGIILTSKAVGIKPFNLMGAILPYAGIAAALSFGLYIVFGFISFG